MNPTFAEQASSEKPLDQIDRNAYEPVYVQLGRLLRRKIISEGLRAGEQLPSESELCKAYNVSSMTVRRAISMLVDEGVVTTERGRGTYVKRLDLGAATFSLDDLQKLYSQATTAKVKILDVQLVSADSKIAEKLSIAEGERTINLRRLIVTDDNPLFYHCEYLICDVHHPIVESELEVTSMQGLLEGRGHNLFKYGKITVSAGIMGEEEACILKVQTPAAAFFLTHLFYGFDERPLSWGRFVCRSDKLRFTTTVGITA